MPDVKVRFPDQLMHYQRTRERFAEEAAEAVAQHMECHDYAGKPVGLEPDHIDVHLQPYNHKKSDARFRNGAVLVEITGYDYPDRLDNISDRLRMIKRKLGLSLGIGHFPGDCDVDEYIRITYIPIPDGCYI